MGCILLGGGSSGIARQHYNNKKKFGAEKGQNWTSFPTKQTYRFYIVYEDTELSNYGSAQILNVYTQVQLPASLKILFLKHAKQHLRCSRDHGEHEQHLDAGLMFITGHYHQYILVPPQKCWLRHS